MTDRTETFVYLCIQCPIGCRLEVDATDDQVIAVRGATCTHGDRYARQEHVDPRRAVSTTVAIAGATVARLPVRTARPVPKGRVREVVRAIRRLEMTAPVRRGQVVVDDVAGLGIAVVATRTFPAVPDEGVTEAGHSALHGFTSSFNDVEDTVFEEGSTT